MSQFLYERMDDEAFYDKKLDDQERLLRGNKDRARVIHSASFRRL